MWGGLFNPVPSSKARNVDILGIVNMAHMAGLKEVKS